MFQYVSLAKDKSWQPGPYDGVELLVLHKHETTGGVTVLRKFKAGTTVPAHIHPQANESVYILSGEWEEAGVIYTAGTYFFAPRGEQHGSASRENRSHQRHQFRWTAHGCLILVKGKSQIVIALVTAPNLKVARKLAQIILKERLAACANLLPKIESYYWWQGKIERSAEILILLKTTQSQVRKLEQSVLENHPYDTPEFIVISVASGNERYLHWITDSVK